jgi:ring-1,2-phenylacetyl-CoA epoxidase subunit PaaC
MPGALVAIADPAVRGAFREWLLRTADDELILGHRHSEWTGVGPDIESDVAMSSIAQEEMGHARVFYEQIASDEGGDVDRIAYGRAPTEYRHAVLLERENAGWEYSIVRLSLYELFEAGRLRLLAACGREPVAPLARAIGREERYHRLFAETWLRRLAGAPEGRSRVQATLEAAWPEALGLFEETPADELLRREGLLGETQAEQRESWEAALREILTDAGLAVPQPPARGAGAGQGGRRGVHTPEFERLLGQMTEVWRSDSEAKW